MVPQPERQTYTVVLCENSRSVSYHIDAQILESASVNPFKVLMRIIDDSGIFDHAKPGAADARRQWLATRLKNAIAGATRGLEA